MVIFDCSRAPHLNSLPLVESSILDLYMQRPFPSEVCAIGTRLGVEFDSVSTAEVNSSPLVQCWLLLLPCRIHLSFEVVAGYLGQVFRLSL